MSEPSVIIDVAMPPSGARDKRVMSLTEPREIPTPRTNAAILRSKGQWSFEIRDECEKLERELTAAKELLCEIRDGEVNAQDEADKFLRDHQPSALSAAKGQLAARTKELEEAHAACDGFSVRNTRDSYPADPAERDLNLRERVEVLRRAIDDYQRWEREGEQMRATLASDLQDCQGRLETAEASADKYKSMYVADWTECEKALEAAGIDFTVGEDGGKAVITGIQELITRELAMRDAKESEVDLLLQWMEDKGLSWRATILDIKDARAALSAPGPAVEIFS